MREIRKLATLSVSFAAAVFLAHYLIPAQWLVPLSIAFAVIGIAGLVIHNNLGRRTALIGLALACGFMLYHVHYARVIAPCEELVGEELTVSARVSSYPDVRDNCILQNVRFCDDKLPDVSGIVIDYNSDEATLIPGDEITVTLKLRPANMRYESEYDVNISKGLYIVGTVCGEIERTGHWNKSFLYLPQHIGNSLRDKIDEIFPDSAAFFMKALLTGDKSEYYAEHQDLSSAMNIAGLAHVVRFLECTLHSLSDLCSLCSAKTEEAPFCA